MQIDSVSSLAHLFDARAQTERSSASRVKESEGATASESRAQSPSSSAAPSEPGRHFVLSTVGASSLAAAYQAMRALEAGQGGDAAPAATDTGNSPAAIASGVGVPGALSAYGEILAMDMETGD